VLVHRAEVVGDEARRAQMIAVVEEFKLLERRMVRERRGAVGVRESPVDALLGAAAAQDGVLEPLAVGECDGAGGAALEAAAVFFELGDYSCLSGEDVLTGKIAVLEAVEAVEVDALVPASFLDDALAAVVVEEGGAVSAVNDLLDPVFFVPDNGP